MLPFSIYPALGAYPVEIDMVTSYLEIMAFLCRETQIKLRMDVDDLPTYPANQVVVRRHVRVIPFLAWIEGQFKNVVFIF